jgi:thiosulfate/3-mercaptopyruvate sulfurtransferase
LKRVAYLFLAFAVSVAFAGESVTAPAPVSAAPAPEPEAPTEYPRKNLLADVHDVALLARLPVAPFTLIDARSASAYATGHIRGAYNVPSDDLQDTSNPPYFLPTLDTVKKVFSEARVHNKQRVIVYDDEDGRLAARVWFTLHAYGHEDVAILHGGLGKWKAAGKDVTDALPIEAALGTFEPSPKLRGVCEFADLAQYHVRVQSIGALPPTTLLDARSAKEYSGEDSRAKNPGHIPGAANVEWSALMLGKEKERVWRSAPQIHAILRIGGIDSQYPICVYDQAGGRSAHLYFTLYLMGFKNIVNYSAGWREYGNKDGVEVER